ncbi:MAG: quinolinate phosphoribosyl transferase [Gemmatimonadota bacterium]|nr:quinolinate phosphoribosyl transferase [Gemmatimonadota bacterium]
MKPWTRPASDRLLLHRDLTRFPAELFQFDPRIRDGWLSDRYFVRAAATLRHAGRDPVVTLQVFPRRSGMVAGLYECVRMLQTQLASGYDYRDLEVWTLRDGDPIEPWDVAFRISGPYVGFAHLETTIDGILARRSRVATNVSRAVSAAGDVPVIYFAPRHDDWRIQTPDGYAARIGGGQSVSSDAGAAWWGGEGVGTMPHGLIAAYQGDVVAATIGFTRYVKDHEPDVPVISLVDFNNDCVRDSVAVARAMRDEFGDGVLHGVRLDTSNLLVDRSLVGDELLWGREDLRGVNPHLVVKVRSALDAEGFDYVGIVVSGGFTPRRIQEFAALNLPIVGYGVGSSVLGRGNELDGVVPDFDFTADVVEVDGESVAKVGRHRLENPRLLKIDWDLLARADEGESI